MYKLLLMENNLEARDRVHEALTASGLKVSLTEVESCEEAISLFENSSFDCLVLESCSTHKTLIGAMKKLTRDPSWPAIPVVVLENDIPPKVDVEITEMGVWDVLNKDYFTVPQFIRTLNNLLAFHRMEITSQQAEKDLVKFRQQEHTPPDRRALGELAADIGHDFNNLLTVVLANLRMAASEKMSKSAEDHVHKAMDQVLQGATLTQDLLVYSQKTNPTFRVVEPNGLVKGIHSRVRRFLGQTIGLDHNLSIRRLRIFVDPLEFENSLIALVQNSSEAISDFGQITIKVSECEVDGTRNGEKKFKPGNYVLFTVEDDGNGMTPGVIKKALIPMFTTKKDTEGAGLGLSKVDSFVKQTGGYLKIESVVNRGTKVKMFLPHSKLIEEREAYSKAGKGALDLNGKGQTILLVEDDVSVLNVVALALKSKNYNVLKAEDAEEAFEIIITAKHIDMLVTDVILPDNLTGKDVAERFHHKFPKQGIIYCSGYHEDLVREELSLGPEGSIISKPYEVSSLLIKMARIFQKK